MTGAARSWGRLATDPTIAESEVIDALLELLTCLLSDHEQASCLGRAAVQRRNADDWRLCFPLTKTSLQSSKNSQRPLPNRVPIPFELDSPSTPYWTG